jgi:hypothetical protein
VHNPATDWTIPYNTFNEAAFNLPLDLKRLFVRHLVYHPFPVVVLSACFGSFFAPYQK